MVQELMYKRIGKRVKERGGERGVVGDKFRPVRIHYLHYHVGEGVTHVWEVLDEVGGWMGQLGLGEKSCD